MADASKVYEFNAGLYNADGVSFAVIQIDGRDEVHARRRLIKHSIRRGFWVKEITLVKEVK